MPSTDALAKAPSSCCSAVGIPDPVRRLQAYPHELSGGMCQRVILALAIANAPRLLIVDEPTSGLDVTISVQILDLLRDAGAQARLRACSSVSRDLGVVAHYCERVAGHAAPAASSRKRPVRQLLRRAAERLQPEAAARRRRRPGRRSRQHRHLADDARPSRGRKTERRSRSPGAARPGQALPGQAAAALLTAVNDVSLRHRPRRGRRARRRERLRQDHRRPLHPAADRADRRHGLLQWAGRHACCRGRSSGKLRSRIQMVFQDPFDSMDPRQRIGDAIEEPLPLTTDMTPRRSARRASPSFSTWSG